MYNVLSNSPTSLLLGQLWASRGGETLKSSGDLGAEGGEVHKWRWKSVYTSVMFLGFKDHSVPETQKGRVGKGHHRYWDILFKNAFAYRLCDLIWIPGL